MQVTFDAHDPRAQSRFWAEVLGYVIPGPPGVELPDGVDPFDAWGTFLAKIGVPESEHNSRSAIEDPDGDGPRVFFQQVPEEKVGKNRVHLDFQMGGEEARIETAERLLGLGATKLWDGQQGPNKWVTMADPEGNELCIAD